MSDDKKMQNFFQTSMEEYSRLYQSYITEENPDLSPSHKESFEMGFVQALALLSKPENLPKIPEVAALIKDLKDSRDSINKMFGTRNSYASLKPFGLC